MRSALGWDESSSGSHTLGVDWMPPSLVSVGDSKPLLESSPFFAKRSHRSAVSGLIGNALPLADNVQ